VRSVRWLPLFALLFWPCGAKAAPVIVHTCSIDGNGTDPTTCTITGVSANAWLIGGTWGYGGIGACCGITDTFGLTYNFNGSVGTRGAEIYRAGASADFLISFYAFTGLHSGSDTISVGNSHSSTYVVYEVSGVNAFDSANANFGTSGGSGTISSGNFTTAASGEFIFAFGFSFATSTLGAGTGYTGDVTTEAHFFGDAGTTMSEYQVSGAAGTYAGTFTQNTGTGYMVVAMAFGPSSPTNRQSHSHIIRYHLPDSHRAPILFARAAWRREGELN
jgi:hypothetical protein